MLFPLKNKIRKTRCENNFFQFFYTEFRNEIYQEEDLVLKEKRCTQQKEKNENYHINFNQIKCAFLWID